MTVSAASNPPTRTLEITAASGIGRLSIPMEPDPLHRRWLGALSIAGGTFHVDAIEVCPRRPARARCASMQACVDAVVDRDGNQAMRTVPIAGKPHLVVIYPRED